MGKPLTTTSCDQGIDPTVVELQYVGKWSEGDTRRMPCFYVYEFMDSQGVRYRYTQKARDTTSIFCGICDHLRKSDSVEVKARFGCCSFTYRKSPHYDSEDWLQEARYFVRPQMMRAPKKRARTMRSWERENVAEWSP